jgi:DNA-binding response OmpR family regulator
LALSAASPSRKPEGSCCVNRNDDGAFAICLSCTVLNEELARILVLDSDKDHANALMVALEEQGHAVTVITQKDFSALLERGLWQYDVVILVVTDTRSENWALLQKICRWSPKHLPKPQVLCLSTVRQDPDIRIRIERQGARFLHER